MSEIILHNYPASPVSEKVRVAFGIRGLSWRSVEVPRLGRVCVHFPRLGFRVERA